MTCKVCGEVGHSGNNYPETHEDTVYINNGFRWGNNNWWNNQSRPQGGNSNYNSNFNSNQPTLKDLVLGQAKINENLTKKLTDNDKLLENINSKIEGLSSCVKNQLSFNKIIEMQITQIASSLPISDSGKILGKPKTSLESIKMISTRFVKPLCQESHDYLYIHHLSSRKKILAARQSHARSGHMSSITPYVTLERASMSCPR